MSAVIRSLCRWNWRGNKSNKPKETSTFTGSSGWLWPSSLIVSPACFFASVVLFRLWCWFCFFCGSLLVLRCWFGEKKHFSLCTCSPFSHPPVGPYGLRFSRWGPGRWVCFVGISLRFSQRIIAAFSSEEKRASKGFNHREKAFLFEVFELWKEPLALQGWLQRFVL